MITTPEQAALKAREQFAGLLDLVQRAARDGQRIDTVERELMRQLLGLGHTMLSAFIARQGDGDIGPETETPEGRIIRRLPESHDRRYVSIFGELTIARVAYGSREGQRIERVPLDERLGLPEGEFSYVLEDWSQRLCLKESFAEAGRSLETLLGLKLGTRTLEHMGREVAGYAPSFQDALPLPPTEEEGSLLVVTADGKGVPMRRPPQDGPRPHHRRTKGEKAKKKQMACVGAVYTIEPFVRKADDILDEVLRDERAGPRPEPRHKHVWAEMTRQVGGETVHAKEALFAHLEAEAAARNSGHDHPVICLLDGERALWDMQREHFPDAVGVLDLFHVLERLWAIAHCFHAEGSDGARQYVEERLRDLLQGRVGYVIAGLRRRLGGGKLSGLKRKVIKSAVEYLANNRDHMRYDEYLAAGYPIGSGVAEGACRHLVKDRGWPRLLATGAAKPHEMEPRSDPRPPVAARPRLQATGATRDVPGDRQRAGDGAPTRRVLLFRRSPRSRDEADGLRPARRTSRAANHRRLDGRRARRRGPVIPASTDNLAGPGR